MKKLIYTLALLLLVQTVSMCQWVNYQIGIDTVGIDYNIYSFAANGNNLYAGTGFGIYKSTNDGVNWNKIYNYQASIIAVNDNYIFRDSWSGIFKSSNDGITWVNDPNIGGQTESITTIGPNVYVCAYGLFKSTNYGTTWDTSIMSYEYYPKRMLLLGSNIFIGESYRLLKSTNNGLNWNTILNHGVWSMAYIPGQKIFVGSDSGVYVSTNNGTNWNIISGLPMKRAVSVLTSGMNVFVCFQSWGTTNNYVYVSTDNGVTWRLKNQGLPTQEVFNTLFINNGYVYLGTEHTQQYTHRYIWRRSLSEIIGIQQISSEIPSKYSLSQNFPNPFNPSTKINFSVTKSGLVTLKVYDVTGKEVSTLVNENQSPGTYSVDFNGSTLTSGTYFYKLTTGDFTETKRMLLIK